MKDKIMGNQITLEGYINLIKENSNIPKQTKRYLINYAYELFGIDEKTQLRNYSYLLDNLGKLISESQHEPKSDLSIYLLDIDDFGKYNKKPYNMILGDKLLKTVANACKKNTKRETDFVARYGLGDENVGVFPKASKNMVFRKAEKIREEIKVTKVDYFMPPKNRPVKVGVTVSIGIGSVKDVPYIKILHSDVGNNLFIGFLDGEYSDLIKEFSKETCIDDEKVDVFLKQLKSASEDYLEENKIKLTPKRVFDPNYDSPIQKQIRKHIGVEGFIGEVDRMLQKAKGTKDEVLVLQS